MCDNIYTWYMFITAVANSSKPPGLDFKTRTNHPVSPGFKIFRPSKDLQHGLQLLYPQDSRDLQFLRNQRWHSCDMAPKDIPPNRRG